jgi:anaphase-promoting complex subunit 6
MSTDSEEDNTKMEEFLRNWRQTAFNSGQFETAIFVGDKLLALTSQYIPSQPRAFSTL